ncbi:hypothetical protein SASPL_132054 [Salvia splendens]|uniref:Formin-like protein 18 n=1 Tax=Salvia splendens TaxID=180675 RepID=A0A8X8XB71_SALSN|nr:hypothetical protein SASPL_132054 [Salvia splendens]
MDPCPFHRILISNLSLRFPLNPHLLPSSYYCKLKFKPFPNQFADLSLQSSDSDSDAVDTKINACFSLSKLELHKLADKTGGSSSLKIEIHRRGAAGCGLRSGRKLVGLRRGAAGPEGDSRQDGEVFQVNGNVKQPVFTCKFGLRSSNERIMRSRSSLSEPSTSASCFGSGAGNKEHPLKERKGWSITIHDLSGSPVAAASMVTPFVPSPGTDRVSRSNPGAWLILLPGHNTWRPWGRLEAWCDGNHLGYRFDLVPDNGIDATTLASSSIPTKKGGKFTVDITTGPTPMTSPNSSFDLSSGSGSGSDLGSAFGSGSWAHLLYRGFVMSSTVQGDGRCSKPEVEVGVQHVSCAEDAAAFVALAAAVDLSMDACRPFSKKLRKELRQPDLE